MNYASLTAFVENFRRAHPNTLFLDAGDAIQGLSFGDISQGRTVLRVMNLMDYNAMVPGNHEFDFGVRNMLQLVEEATFPIIATNLMDDNEEIPLLPMYIIEEMNGVTVAVIGVTTPDIPKLVNPEHIAGYSFPDPIPVLEQIVPDLKKGVDVVVVLAHMGLASENSSAKLAQAVPGIDVIIDGHDHTPLKEGHMVGNTLIANAGEYGEYLGRIDITLYGRKIFRKKASLIDQARINKTPAKDDVNELMIQLQAEYADELLKLRGPVVV